MLGIKFNWYTQLWQKGWKQAAMQRGQPALRLFEQGFAQIAEGFAQILNQKTRTNYKIGTLAHCHIFQLSHCFIASLAH